MVERVAMVAVAVVLAGAMAGAEARAVDVHAREQVAIEREAIELVEQVSDSLRPALTRLTEIQTLLAEWKRASVDRMWASARELAADASSAYLARTENKTAPLKAVDAGLNVRK